MSIRPDEGSQTSSGDGGPEGAPGSSAKASGASGVLKYRLPAYYINAQSSLIIVNLALLLQTRQILFMQMIVLLLKRYIRNSQHHGCTNKVHPMASNGLS